MSALLFEGWSGLSRIPAAPPVAGTPLVVAIHGGTYTSLYFDVPGYSLLDRATDNHIPIVALDRPAYGLTPALTEGTATIANQARHLIPTLHQAWRQYGLGTSGIVLIAHSIGAAIAATIASEAEDLPLIGLAISGVGLRTPGTHRSMWEALPDTPMVEMPTPIKDQLMFGPPGSFDGAVMPAASHIANVPVPKAELVDIVSGWSENVHATLGRITVPVHYRQGEIDRLWIVDQDEVTGFAAALTASPHVDAAIMNGTGHCMDFHHVSAAFQLQQLAFALQCGAECLTSPAPQLTGLYGRERRRPR